MKKFLFKLLIFCIVFMAVDRCFLMLRNYVPSLEADKRLEEVINGEIKTDIMIFGSSRGARNIIASRLSDSLKMSAYNLSYPGGDIEFQTFVLKQVLKYHKPKIIVLSVDDDSELGFSKTVLYRYDRLYPLVKYRVVRDELVRKKEKNKYLSEIFILHQLNKSNFDIRRKRPTKLDRMLPCGSMPISFQAPKFQGIYSDTIRKYDKGSEIEYKRKSFVAFDSLCKASGIKLLVVFPPNFFRHSEGFYRRISEVVSDETYLMRYDSLNSIYKRPDYFYDEGHLIRKGAEIFSNEVAGYIKKHMTESQEEKE